MKKIFTLFAAAAVAFGSLTLSAKEVQLKKDLTLKSELTLTKQEKKMAKMAKSSRSQTKITTNRTPQQLSKVAKADANTTPRKMRLLQARKVDGNSSVEGTWTFSFGDWYFENSIKGTLTKVFEATMDEGYLWFEDPTGYDLPFVGVYNESASTITFPSVGMGEVTLTTGGKAYLKQQPFEYNWDSQGIEDITQLVGRFNASNGTLSFSSDQGLQWLALANQNATEPMGYFAIYDFEGATLKGAGTGGGGSTVGGQGLEGTWEWTFFDDVLQGSTGQQFTVTYICEYEPDYDDYIFDDPTNNELPFFVYYDEATGQVTLPMDLLGNTGQYLVGQMGFETEFSEGQYKYVAKEEIYFNYDSSTGEMVFDSECGILWPAVDPNSYQTVGYFAGYIFVGAVCTEGGGTTPTPGDDDEGWTNIGEATFMDGWVLPAFGINQNDQANWYKVPLQQNDADKSRYRLVDPYHLGPIASYNEATSKGYIVFDVTNPNAVLFEKAVAGFAFKQAGISTFYCYNTLGSIYQDYIGEYTPEQLAAVLEGEIPFTTFKDGVVTLGSAMTSDGLAYDANFGMQGATTGGYGWTDENKNPQNMNAAIYFPEGYTAVKDIISDQGASKAEYFNLQGVRVVNPQPGQILIRRQGNQTEKTVIR